MVMKKEVNFTPGRTIKALTPHDSTNFTDPPRGIIVTSGVVVIVNDDDSTTTLTDGILATGIVHPIAPKRINSTNTTATIYGVY